jgi:hypothetical protein
MRRSRALVPPRMLLVLLLPLRGGDVLGSWGGSGGKFLWPLDALEPLDATKWIWVTWMV